MHLLLLLPAVALADAPFERRLYTDRVDSSSFLWNDWNRFQENYHPLYAVDGDPATAWVEGASTAGAGEWIRFGLTHLDGATSVRLRLQNGYQKSSTLYKANARPKQVTVTLLPGGQTTKVTLRDVEGWQDIRVDQPAGGLEAVLVKVDTVYPGTKYTDLCLSEVEIYATATTPDNPVVEKARMARVLAWKRDRLAAAAMFKTAAGSSLPVAPAYALRGREGPAVPDEGVEWGDDRLGFARAAVEALALWPSEANLPSPTEAIALARVALATRFEGWTPVQAVATDTRPIPAVDGLAPATIWNCFEGPPVWVDEEGKASGSVELPTRGQVGFLRADTIGTFAVRDAPSVLQALEAEAAVCGKDEPQYLSWARMTPATDTSPSRVQALLTVTCATLEVREGRDRIAVPQLAVYDDAGRLSLLVGSSAATSFAWRGDGPAAVISDALRVGAWVGAVRLTEGRTNP